MGGAQNGSAVLLTDRCNADQVLGGFSASSSGGLINGLQFTCTGACSEGQSADECGVCGGSGAPTWYQDVDGDGQGVDSVTVTACTQPSGYASVAGDPQPNCATNNEDVCGVCGGSGEATFYRDIDGDGLGDPADSTTACSAPGGYVSNSGDSEPDCITNDTDVCGVCGGDGLITWYLDQDSDNLGDPGSATTQSCFQPAGYVANNNDTQPTCTTNDEDVCGVCAGPGPSTWYEDGDGDGLGDPASTESACLQPAGYVADNSDACPADNPNDIDGDGICNSDDPDQDGDGCVNGFDPAPTVAATAYNYETHIEPMLTDYGCTGCHFGDDDWSGNINLSVGAGYNELMGGDPQDNSVCVGPLSRSALCPAINKSFITSWRAPRLRCPNAPGLQR